ncbi:MAG: PrsW family glutamic-type intramembrane protease [Verrucomicrobiaceae bacterium]
MSEKQSLFHGWRARTHYLTRDRRFLLRTSAGIIALGMITASMIVVSASREPDGPVSVITPALTIIHREYHELRHAKEPQPRKLAVWLRRLFAQLPKLAGDDDADGFHSFTTAGVIGGYEVAPLITQHATTDAPAGLFREFLAAALDDNDDALAKLEQKSRAQPPQMLAGEFFGSVQKRRGNTEAAMHSFYSEGFHFADAASAREEALRLAVTLRDLDQVRLIAAQPGWIEACHPLLQHHAGALLGDIWMQWRGLIHHRLNEIPYGMLALAFFVAALWYFILVQHSDHAHWRWARPMPALMAGVCSVWPTLTILSWQEFHQGMSADAPFPHDLIYYLLGVGLREEGCKLMLFALFLPWLLWRRAHGLALLTGAFVGLGFSLEENIGYYQEMGGSIAWTRFLSANFLHISLTGICAHSLYEMLRTRFAHAEQFIVTFIAAIAAHGGYDWLGTNKLGDNGWLSIIVLVLTVSRFIDILAEQTRPTRLTISPRAVFTFGSAILIAISFILGAWTSHSMQGVSAAGQECLSMVPIAVLYWRKFENV